MYSLFNIIIDIILFIIAIPLHEFGHYYSSKLMGVRTKLVMKKLMVWGDFDSKLKHFISLISGVIAGIIPILFIDDIIIKIYFIIIYIYMCSSDIIRMIIIILKYKKFNVPKFILKIEEKLVLKRHHKYCNCDYCEEKRNEWLFLYKWS